MVVGLRHLAVDLVDRPDSSSAAEAMSRTLLEASEEAAAALPVFAAA